MPKGIYKRKPRTKSHCQNLSNSLRGRNSWNKGLTFLVREQNPNWKGENASYGAKHSRIRHIFEKPKNCEHCNKVGEKVNGRWNIHWANVSGKYKINRKDWFGLCVKCHAKLDKWWAKTPRNNLGQFTKIS